MINEIIGLIQEAFTAQNRRHYIRRQDERIKEMRDAGFDPTPYLNEVNPNAQQLAKAEREFAKYIESKKSKEAQSKVADKEMESIDDLLDQYAQKDPDGADSIEQEWQMMATGSGAEKANIWIKNELLKRLGKSTAAIADTSKGINWDKFKNAELASTGKKMAYAGYGMADTDPNKLPDEHATSTSSDRRLKHLLLTFKSYVNKEDPTISPRNKNLELASFFDHLISSGKLDIDYNTVAEVFPEIDLKNKIEPEDWKLANARAVKRISNTDMSKLRETMREIMQYGTYKDVNESYELYEDVIIESNGQFKIIPAGTKFILAS